MTSFPGSTPPESEAAPSLVVLPPPPAGEAPPQPVRLTQVPGTGVPVQETAPKPISEIAAEASRAMEELHPPLPAPELVSNADGSPFRVVGDDDREVPLLGQLGKKPRFTWKRHPTMPLREDLGRA